LGGDGIGHCEKEVVMNMCLLLNCYRDRAAGISYGFLFVRFDDDQILQKRKKQLDKRDELLGCILDSAARIKKSKDQFRLTTSDFRTRVAKCTERERERERLWNFETFIVNRTKLPFLCNKPVTYTLNTTLKIELN
jgi:hypothetical protein